MCRHARASLCFCSCAKARFGEGLETRRDNMGKDELMESLLKICGFKRKKITYLRKVLGLAPSYQNNCFVTVTINVNGL